MTKPTFLAFDLGAESGRAMLGTIENQKLSLQEVHRFPNGPIRVLGHLHWDIYRLLEELKTGLRKSLALAPGPIVSVGIDTWGVDFALLGPDGSLLGLPFAYRDSQTDGMVEEFLQSVPKEMVYQRTGIQFQQFNSLIQLFALRRRRYPALEWAAGLLFMPDALTYLLTGVAKSEFSIATTSQIYNPTIGDWDNDQLFAVGLKKSLMQEIVRPGTKVGSLTHEVAAEISAPTLPVIAVATHDTGSAVAAVPAEGTDWAYISSGTWSLMGIEIPVPVLTLDAMRANFTNEGGVDGTFRFLRNIAGLWLLQECRREWLAEREFSYDELMVLASSAPPFRSLVDTDWQGFYRPSDMPEAIREFCRNTGQPTPETQGQFARCVLESLSLKYRSTIEALRKAARATIRTIHIIGGGSRNKLLCQFTANATGLPVIAGPAEATAIGNIMVQARASGFAESFADMRTIVRRSFGLERYLPEQISQWEQAYSRFISLKIPH